MYHLGAFDLRIISFSFEEVMFYTCKTVFPNMLSIQSHKTGGQIENLKTYLHEESTLPCK